MFITKQETNILKGIGILSVILSHTSIMCREAAVTVPFFSNGTVCMAICEAGMSLFLFISGYGSHMSYKARGLENYIKNRFINVLVPYMIIQVISMAVAFFTTGLHGSLLFNLSQLVGINPTNLYDPTMWYISYALFWYVVFWIAYRIGKGSYVSQIMIGVVSIAGFLYVPWYWGNNADYCVLTFFAGVLTARLSDSFVKIPGFAREKVSRIILCVLLAVAGYTLMIRFHRFSIWTENVGALMGMAAFILLIGLFRGRYGFHVLYFVGTISFWLYLLEWKLIIRTGIYNIWGCNYLTYILCFVCTVVLSYACARAYGIFQRRILSSLMSNSLSS